MARGLKKNSNPIGARMISLPSQSAAALSSIDWTSNKIIQDIKDQGKCGSCWAFATVSAIESYAALANGGRLPNLSEQNLVDCVYGSDGCNGGNDDDAFNYLIKNQSGRIAIESNYPYVSDITETVSFILISLIFI